MYRSSNMVCTSTEITKKQVKLPRPLSSTMWEEYKGSQYVDPFLREKADIRPTNDSFNVGRLVFVIAPSMQSKFL